MGFWSTSLYGNDVTLDIKDDYIRYLKKGLSVEETESKVMEEWKDLLGTDEEPLLWLALADTKWKYGLLDEETKKKALYFIEQQPLLEEFTEAGERRGWLNTLNKLKLKLLSEKQGSAKLIVSTPFKSNFWEIGDCYAYKFNSKNFFDKELLGKYIVIQKVNENYSKDSDMTFNIIQVFDKIFDKIPTIEDIKNIKSMILEEKFTCDNNLKHLAGKEKTFDEIIKILRSNKEDYYEYYCDNYKYSTIGELLCFNEKEYKSKNFFYVGNSNGLIPEIALYKKNGKYISLRNIDSFLGLIYNSWNNEEKSLMYMKVNILKTIQEIMKINSKALSLDIQKIYQQAIDKSIRIEYSRNGLKSEFGIYPIEIFTEKLIADFDRGISSDVSDEYTFKYYFDKENNILMWEKKISEKIGDIKVVLPTISNSKEIIQFEDNKLYKNVYAIYVCEYDDKKRIAKYLECKEHNIDGIIKSFYEVNYEYDEQDIYVYVNNYTLDFDLYTIYSIINKKKFDYANEKWNILSKKYKMTNDSIVLISEEKFNI